MKSRLSLIFIFILFLAQLHSQTVPYPDKICGGSNNGIVGKIVDKFNVTPTGQASYEIPISTVSGTGGIIPQLSIVYSSSTKEGLFGSGFDLIGLSIINRAPSNLHRDGHPGYVNFTSSDKFMLDGMRLMPIKNRTNQYLTENNKSFPRIFASGGTESNPSTFTVTTRSGFTYEYVSNTSILNSSTSTNNPLFWLIKKVSDTKGNYYTVTYSGNDANGEYWPTRIDYTGNNDVSPHLDPYASIRFEYTNNSYSVNTYIYGHKVKRSQIISRISIYSGNKCMKYYQMSYQVVNNKQQLSSVTEYASDGTKKNPTNFTWHNLPEFKITNVNYSTVSSIYKANLTVGDYNGDGKADFVATPQNSKSGWTGWRLFLSQGTYLDYEASGNLKLDGEIQQVVSGDFNGDGYDDIVIKRKYNNYYDSDLYLSKVSGKNVTLVFNKCFISDTRNYTIRTIETNGDGAADIFLWYENSKDCKIIRSEQQSSKMLPLNYTATRYCSVNWDRVEFVDFNGDGLTDVMNLDSNGYYLLESDGYGTMSQTKSSTWPDKNHHLYFGDFNGDGKTDMLLTGWNNDPNKDGWSNWNIQFSTGTGFVRVDIPKKFISKEKTIFIVDINGDGKDDFYAVDKTISDDKMAQACAYLNDGTGCNFQQVKGASTYGLDKWNYYIGDFNGDGKADFVCTSNWDKSNWNGYQLFLMPEDKNNLLASITDGLGKTTAISYKYMSDNSIHERGTTNSYPVSSFNTSWPLVDNVTMPNGLGGKNTTSYRYKNALIHKRGRGVLGFEYFITKDEATNIETTTQFEVDSTEYVTAVKSVETRVAGKLINKSDYQNQLFYLDKRYSDNNIFTFVPVSSTDRKYEYNTGDLISEMITSTDYDDYGNITKIITKNGDHTITTTNTYGNKWFGRLTQAVVLKENGQESISRTSKFIYYGTWMLASEIVEPDDTQYGYKKVYKDDSFGNIFESTVTPNNTDYSSRTEKSQYDDKGRFETQSTNSLNFTTTNGVDPDLCVANRIIDENGIETYYTYDTLGQLILTKSPLGYVQSVNRWSNGHTDAPNNAVYFTYTESTGEPSQTEFFDCMGRSIRKVTEGLNGEKIYTDVVYNAKGQIEKTSEPYFSGQVVYWNINEYDPDGRITKQTAADGTYYTFQYNGLTSVTADPLGQVTTKIMDIYGNLIKSIDSKNGNVQYKYDVDGKCTEVTGPRTTIKTEYDKMGNRTKLIDPDLGTTEYGYNAYGELVWQKDNKGNTKFTYDVAGRLVNETRSDMTIENVYDTKWKGELSSSSCSNNIFHDYTYDSYGRIINETENIQGKSYTTAMTYNSLNKVDVITYPSGFKVKNGYSSMGYQSTVSNADNGKVYWAANTMNARGQLEKVTLGNNLSTTISYNPLKGYITNITTPGIQNWSYSFNAVGNLTDRKDNLKNLSEHFDYDELNRLWKVSQNDTLKQEILYDGAGNITYKTGIGTSFGYEDNTNKLLSISGAGYNPLSWDEITYSSFNKITYVKQDTNSMALTYGEDKTREKSIIINNGVTDTKYYIGNLYEEEYINNEIKQINYIFADGKAIAIYEKSNVNGDEFRYLHHDHLGSIQAYSDENGNLVQELSYDTWGRRRNPANWEYYPSLTDANAWHPRGFTGHEHLDMFEMINMDGRMYDPAIGRFMSPDPFVQAPDYTQGLNRYAYCLNNPLSLVDPSGYSWFSRNWKSLLSTSIGIAASIVSGGLASGVGGVMISGAIGGASAALSGALLNGANIGQIAKSTFTGGFWGTAGAFLSYGSGDGEFFERLFKHSFSQAWLEGIQGGNIEHGVMMGLVSDAGGNVLSRYGENIGDVGRIAINSILSGTISELGGGKFANGAMTGAFAYLFNESKHPQYNTLFNKKGRVRAYKYMIKRSLEDNCEVVGAILDDGGVLVFKDEGNAYAHSFFPHITKDGHVYVKVNRRLIEAIGNVHTHPGSYSSDQANPLRISPRDESCARTCFGGELTIIMTKYKIVYNVNVNGNGERYPREVMEIK